MSNSLSSIIPMILANALVTFRNNSITASLVNRGYDSDFKKKGNTINVPYYNSPTVQDITAGRGNENTPSDVEASSIAIVLNKWKEVKIQFSDKDLKEIEQGRPSEALNKAVIALADYVDSFVLNDMGVSGFNTVGTVGSALSDPTKLVDASVFLGKENVPKRGRSTLINPTVAGAFIKDTNLSEVDKAGSAEALRDATVGRLYSFNNYETNNLDDFVGGTLNDGTDKSALVSTDTAVGANTIGFDESTLTGTLVKGDIFTLAGDTQQYVVTADATASANAISVTFTPSLKVATTDGVAVSFVADYTNAGVAFHEDSYVFASAPVAIDFTGGNLVQSHTDPVSGITFTYEVERVGKSTEHSLSILFGGKVVKPQGLVRLVS